jgi:cytochrome c553
MNTRHILLSLILTVVSSSVIAEGDAEKGKELSRFCSGCHGENGIANNPTNPNLAGQNEKYLKYALKAYRDGSRSGGLAVVMRPNAARLTDQEIADLAAYFSSLPGRNAK